MVMELPYKWKSERLKYKKAAPHNETAVKQKSQSSNIDKKILVKK